MKFLGRLFLLLLAVTLSPLLLVGFVWSTVKFAIRAKFAQWFTRLGEYFLQIAISIDQLGNVMCQDLFNYALIKDDSQPFGDPDETISSVLGKNLVKGNLTRAGKVLDAILNTVDPGHSIDAIDE